MTVFHLVTLIATASLTQGPAPTAVPAAVADTAAAPGSFG